MGVSVENQRWTSRVSDLRRIPAAVRFLSCEPLLGPLALNLDGIHWVIAGGESGTVLGRCGSSGRRQCATSASKRACRSSSSNGARTMRMRSDEEKGVGTTPRGKDLERDACRV